MGVIDAIADGCFAVARRPVLLIPPVTLDLFYWLGSRLTVAPLTEATIRGVQRTGTVDQELIASLLRFEQESNLLAVLSPGMKTLLARTLLPIPALPVPASRTVTRPWGQGVLDPGHWALVLLSLVVLGALGLLCLALYLCGVAQLVRDEPFNLRLLVRRAPACWVRLLGLGAIVVGVVALVGMPVLLLAGLLTVASISPAPLLLLAIPPLVWLYCYLILAPEAIVVSDVGPLRAIKLSVEVVRRNFWATAGLIAATLLISQGFPLAWGLLARQVAGVPLAIVGNAFVGTGLAAAAMFFYRERLAALEKPSVVGQQRPTDR